MMLQELPPLLETSHCTVGVGPPDAAAVNDALESTATVSLAGWVTTCGAPVVTGDSSSLGDGVVVTGGGLAVAGGSASLGGGDVVTGGCVIVSVAAFVSALPAELLNTARYSLPFSLELAVNE